MSSVFTKIINREIPAHIVAEDENFIAFLDVFPLAPGHTLVIPKREIDYIFDMEEEYFKELWSFAKMVSKGVKQAIDCKRVGIAVIGLEVPHAHIHLVPLNSVGDINFERPKLKFTSEQMAETAEKIRRGLAL
jgi:histidine triad (HIT) family protein